MDHTLILPANVTLGNPIPANVTLAAVMGRRPNGDTIVLGMIT